MILGKYLLHWTDINVVQTKDMISHQDYVNVIKPTKLAIHELEALKKPENKEMISALKDKLKVFGDNWFTDESPIGKAIQSGVLLSDYGNFNLKSQKL